MTTEIQFHLYLNGEPTGGIFDNLDAAKAAAGEEIERRQEVRIETINSLAPVSTWYYDYDLNDWVRSG